MEVPKYHHQPEVVEDDDTERWLNEGGHLPPIDETQTDEVQQPVDQPSEPES